VFCERTSVRLDVHARSVVAAAIDGQPGEIFRARLTPACEHVVGWVSALPGPVAALYEAGPDRVRAVPGAERRRDPLRGGRVVEAAAAGWGSGEDRCPGCVAGTKEQ
jgi:hypothetical protein